MSFTMFRRPVHQLLTAGKQVVRVQPKLGEEICTARIQKWSYCVQRCHHVFFRASVANGTWQRTRQQQHYSTSQYPHPFTIAAMTGSSAYQAPLSSTGLTPMPLWDLPDTTFKKCHVRLYSTKPPSSPSTQTDENHNESKSAKVRIEEEERTEIKVKTGEEKKEEKLSLVQKFKLMYKQYWYVLIPVHVVTSIVWYGSFFIAAKSGVDIVPMMEKLGAGEKILSHLRNSNAGYYAIAYAMYKIATPARYTVTIGGTTLSINYLKKRGYIKPVPSSEQLKEMYEVICMKLRSITRKIFKRKDETTLPTRLYRPL
ncbi:protein FAM210A-like isoform X2 [Penaeus japonicus]|uniref:protein FAM210A-like isoform X2 n=1 Tax=Penaeus japonicus TaxID=27405 RepID=UPI001C70C1BF|nr:protein FAM210A-like isoform X2 [Penaeus japonicus]